MKIGTKIAAAFALCLVMTTAMGIISYRSSSHQIQASQWVVHAEQVLENLEGVLSILKDAETGQRGFILTSQDRYLEPYNAAVAQIQQRLDTVGSLTRDDPTQQQDLQHVRTLTEAKLAELSKTIQLARRGGQEAALPTIVSDQGKRIMDDIRVVVGRMEAQEQNLLHARTVLADASAHRTVWTILIGVPLLFLLLVAVAVALTYDIARPLAAITEAAQRISQGDLSVPAMGGRRRDEVGMLQQSFGRMTVWLREMAYHARQIAARDLTIAVKPQSERDELGHSFSTMVSNLRTTTEELQEQSEELSQQNEELQSQSEELAQQNEELQRQTEELGQQGEELQTQSEELQTANEELHQRESMLATILTSLRGASDEHQVMARICQSLLPLLGSAAAAAAVVEQEGEDLAVRTHANLDDLARQRWPIERSFARIVMERGQTAYIDDLATRPDLVISQRKRQLFRSILAAPLLLHGKPIGAVEAYAEAPCRWTAEQFRIIEWVAAQCSMILEIMRAKAAMRESEALLRAITDNAPDPIFLKDRACRMLLANPATLAALQKRSEEVVGKTDAEFYDDPAIGRRMMANDRRVMESGQTEVVEEVVPSASGPRTFLSAKTPYRDAEGRVIGLIGVARDITERKRAEEALRESEERLRFALEINHTGAWDLDLRDHSAHRSLEHDRIFGYAELLPQWTYEMFLEHVLPEDRPTVDSKFRHGVETGSDWNFECRIRRADQQIRWIWAAGRHRADAAGVRIGIAGIVQDITERKRAEESSRESEARFRTLADAIPQLAWMARADGFIFWYNRRWHDYTGTTPQQMEGWGWQSVHDPKILPQVLERWKASIATGEPFEMVFPLRGADGQFRLFLTRVQPLKDAAGQVVQWFGTNTDVEEMTQAKESLRKSEERLRLAQASAQAGVWDWNPRTGETVFTEENERLYGLSPGTVHTYQDFRQRVHPDDTAKMEAERDAAIANRQPFDLEFRIVQESGECRWLSAKGGAVYDEAGKVARVFGVNVDITQRKRAEQQLRELNETLERRVTERTAEAEHRANQLQRLAGELTQAEQKERQRLATILHDHLQQLLVGAKFHLDILHGQTADAQVREGLRHVDELLDQSLTTSRSLTVELSPPILQEGTFAQVLHWLARWAKEKHALIVDVQADEQVNVQDKGVRALLFQAMRELLLNVRKHARVDKACVCMKRCGRQMEIVVTDAGVGFDPAVRRHHDPHGNGSGSGFGLFSIAERLELLAGRMEVSSCPGRGTRIRLVAPPEASVPEAAASLPSPMASQSADTQPSPAHESQKIRVLLADDHAVVRDGLARLLGMQPDITVVGQAADGLEAVEMARQLRPDVIVMDVSMPNLGGLEATQRILRDLPGMRIIGLSMHVQEDVAAQMIAAGATAYLTKTSQPPKLLAAIRQCARARSSS